MAAAALLLLLIATLGSIAPSVAISADCSSCDASLTAPVYYGCSENLSAFIAINDQKLECGAALSMEQTSSSTSKFYYPDAEDGSLYSLILIDTTDIDPIVGTVPPFLPFPIIHYGALNIEADVLRDGMSLDNFHFDGAGVTRVSPFWEWQPLVPLEDLSKIPPSGIPPPDINTRAFNYEFLLGKQAWEKSDPLTDQNVNWDFIAYLRRTIVGEPIQTTYISSGYCVVDVDEGVLDSYGCAVSAETGSGLGSVPEIVGPSVAMEGTGMTSPSTNIGGMGTTTEATTTTTIATTEGTIKSTSPPATEPVIAEEVCDCERDGQPLPPTVYMEQKWDAQQVLLIQTTSDGTGSKLIENTCGPDTYYDTTAVVLGVNRTVDPTATAIGANNEGQVMNSCDAISFTTYERDWVDGCEGQSDPGRKSMGWCGYVYLTPNADPSDPYLVAAGVQSFVEVDSSICVEKAVQCGQFVSPTGCTNTPAFSDNWGGGCAEYESPNNYPSWCEAYGNEGEEGMTPNENCCICKELADGSATAPTERPSIATPNPTASPTIAKDTTTSAPTSADTTGSSPTKEPSPIATQNPTTTTAKDTFSSAPTTGPTKRPAQTPTSSASSWSINFLPLTAMLLLSSCILKDLLIFR